MAKSDHECDKRCFMCDRPHDSFNHLHLSPETGESQEQVIALCIPCLAQLAGGMASVINAYAAGGYAFDHYGQRHLTRYRTRKGQSGTPIPHWAEVVLEELRQQAQKMQQDEGSDGN